MTALLAFWEVSRSVRSRPGALGGLLGPAVPDHRQAGGAQCRGRVGRAGEAAGFVCAISVARALTRSAAPSVSSSTTAKRSGSFRLEHAVGVVRAPATWRGNWLRVTRQAVSTATRPSVPCTRGAGSQCGVTLTLGVAESPGGTADLEVEDEAELAHQRRVGVERAQVWRGSRTSAPVCDGAGRARCRPGSGMGQMVEPDGGGDVVPTGSTAAVVLVGGKVLRQQRGRREAERGRSWRPPV